MSTKTTIWDGFIRGYHWLQAISIAGLWYTGTEGLMDWHFSIAYALLALLTTRLIWGLFGSDTAKLSSLFHSPRAVIQHLGELHQSNSEHTAHPHKSDIGHNPAGSYMVLGFFVLIATQLTTGLFANDDIVSEGPLAMYISGELSSRLTELHALNFDFLLGAIGLHLAAILLYRFKSIDLIGPMLHGKKELVDQTAPKMRNGAIGWGVFVAVATAIYFLWAKDVIIYLF
ncbi:cytochrome b/b6 domain-containing protein [Photobacterium kagoshimensis]|uniref:cytochrome b/b6 domain-containing protein n=1 Tax=Photobacterium kagoshimensis TaxID=2910242 RepID=UPI003D0E57CA